jgi:hypothetical protein
VVDLAVGHVELVEAQALVSVGLEVCEGLRRVVGPQHERDERLGGREGGVVKDGEGALDVLGSEQVPAVELGAHVARGVEGDGLGRLAGEARRVAGEEVQGRERRRAATSRGQVAEDECVELELVSNSVASPRRPEGLRTSNSAPSPRRTETPLPTEHCN